MKSIKDSIKLYRFNLFRTVTFELLLKIMAAVALVPAYYGILNLAIRGAGIEYLSKENMRRFFRAPTTYLYMALILLLIVFYMLIEVSAISVSYDRTNRMEKTGAFKMLIKGFANAARIFHPKNILLLIFIPFYIPVFGTFVLEFKFFNLGLPYYFTDFIMSNKILARGMIVSYVIMAIFSFRYTLAIHIFTKEKIKFTDALKRVHELDRSTHKFNGMGSVIWSVTLISSAVIIRKILTGPVLKFVLDIPAFGKTTGTLFEIAVTVISAIFALIAMPLIYSYLCNTYYNIVPEPENTTNIDFEENYDPKKDRMRERAGVVMTVAMAIVLNFSFLLLSESGVIHLNSGTEHQFKIIAHRGDSENAPENTLAAFDKAIENGADMVELDCHETKDGVIVVIHDDNLKRTCGVNKKVKNMTYAEIEKYSAGAYFGDRYYAEKVPTLDETIELVGNRAKMCIELKPDSRDTDLEEKVVKIIEKHDYTSQCVVQSLSYHSISKVKKMNKNIKTIYVMAVAMGNFQNLKSADGYNIKAGYVKNSDVVNVHKEGKEIYVWNVNDEENLHKFMIMGVDAILTNNPGGMRKAMYANYYETSPIDDLNVYVGNIL